MKTKLSHSQLGRFQMCPKSYQYHYIDKIRPTVTHASLVFGSAVDAALGSLLTNDGQSPEEVFNNAFENASVNDKKTYIPSCLDLVYSNNDFDSDLLQSEDYVKAGCVLDDYKKISEKKKTTGLVSLSAREHTIYNLLNWFSLRRKGLLMIEAYRKKVLPKINKVLATQEQVSLKNADGDEIIGYVDLVADIKGHGPVILDNKTSAMEYEEDSVLSSPQLSLYLHMLEEKYQTRKAGYIVMRKQVIKNRKKVCSICGYDGSGGRHKTCDNVINSKRCNGNWTETIDPDIYIQIIIDEIPARTEEIVLQNIDDINCAIKQGSFTRNLNSCSNWYGGKCCYYNKCYKDSNEGLVDMNKQRENK